MGLIFLWMPYWNIETTSLKNGERQGMRTILKNQ
jgi:hypothetical protein